MLLAREPHAVRPVPWVLHLLIGRLRELILHEPHLLHVSVHYIMDNLPLIILLGHLALAGVAELVERVGGFADIAAVSEVQVDSEVVVVLLVVQNGVRVHSSLVEGVAIVLLFRHETCIHGEAAQQLFVLQVYQAEVQISADYLAAFAGLLVINEDLHHVLLVGFVGLRQLVNRVLFVLHFCLGVVGPNHFKILAIHDLDDGLHQIASRLGDRGDSDQLYSLQAGALDLSLECHFEVLHVPLLAGLRHPTASEEPLPSIICNRVHKVICQARVDQEAGDGSARPAFAGIAVDRDDVFVRFVDVVEHVFARLEQQRQRWRMVVQPLVVVHSVVELFFVDHPVAHVVYPVALRVHVVEELAHLVDVVSIQLLGPLAGGEAHGNDSVGDVTQVQVVPLSLVPPPLAGDQFL